MSCDTFQGALAHPLPRQLPFDFGENPPVSLPPPAPTRGHQRSRTTVDLPPLFSRTQSSSPTRSSTFLPFLRPQSTRSLSPERISPIDAAEYGVQTPSEESVTKKRSSLASWFDGSSDPVNITLVPSPRKEKLDPVHEAGTMDDLFSASHASLDTFTERPQRKPGLSGSATPGISRFNFFRKPTISQPCPDGAPVDELAQLDIREALFPHGYPDEFSPATFKNLQLNAEGTLCRFQQAYRDQRKSLRNVTSTKNVQADELEAAQTRNEHLKLQLEEMAERVAEREKTITDLRLQLKTQRQSLDPHLSQQQSIRKISPESSTAEEPNPRLKYCRNRSSDISTSGESELGSDVSSVVSVFSEALSSAPSRMTSIPSPVLKSSHVAYSGDHCPKCHGLNASEAWDVVGMMKMESEALKQRISQLESAQDDALDFLSGLKLT
ncbi:uncharacterized protein Z518_01595 [Rhinocladiella mackenziei CBS 650.93]|uniref:Uncharacterized protein n=1 Tax=Rhinocladiella mackenziei CBS 650.93 TaxID=1442369 RepID=A0A0D2G6D7_9EURO|nr:uncharacterized protein Z518_01595 [Rhinocladiella mackenziei CBS 650.93]KIX10512.1 hypothetical protein Z518_01595 [Rhinocladiella mackenziei CBS 650.93]